MLGLRRSSPGYVGSRRQVAPLFTDMSEQDEAAAAIKREWLAIRRQEHRESLRRRSFLTSPGSSLPIPTDDEDSFSGPPKPLRELWLATNSAAAAVELEHQQPLWAAAERVPGAGREEQKQLTKHRWLAQARLACERQLRRCNEEVAHSVESACADSPSSTPLPAPRASS